MGSGSYKKLPTYLTFDPADFPNLTRKNHRVTSRQNDAQNCIAYAAGDEIHSWWPLSAKYFPGRYPPPYYWPQDCDSVVTVDAFECAFATVRFERCANGQLEQGYEKIAIFALGNRPNLTVEHAAKQSPHRNGKWRSKMGDDYDIEHDLTAVEGPCYGYVVGFMRRAVREMR